MLESIKNTKTIRKHFSMGRDWTVHLKAENDEKIYDGKKINEHAINFYKNLYKNLADVTQFNMPLSEYKPPFFLMKFGQ